MDLWNCAIHPNRPVAYLVRSGVGAENPITRGPARSRAGLALPPAPNWTTRSSDPSRRGSDRLAAASIEH
jgi:hypothetical protein